jgi:hypothetical protein
VKNKKLTAIKIEVINTFSVSLAESESSVKKTFEGPGLKTGRKKRGGWSIHSTIVFFWTCWTRTNSINSSNTMTDPQKNSLLVSQRTDSIQRKEAHGLNTFISFFKTELISEIKSDFFNIPSNNNNLNSDIGKTPEGNNIERLNKMGMHSEAKGLEYLVIFIRIILQERRISNHCPRLTSHLSHRILVLG